MMMREQQIRLEDKSLRAELREVPKFCRRIKMKIRRMRGLNPVGFTTEQKNGRYRLCDSTTSFPCTEWHGTYIEAVIALRSIVRCHG